MKSERASGILLHITSLPGPYGIGDLGAEAYRFVDFLHETKQKVWQILPLTNTEKCSPYSAVSAIAGFPLLISLDRLLDMKLLTKEDLNTPSASQFDDGYVKFKQVTDYKYSMLRKAFANFQQQQQQHQQAKSINASLEEFLQAESSWLDDYALFMTIKELRKNESWSQWPHELKYRQADGLDRIRQEHKDLILYHSFVQFLFHQQWLQLKTYANQLEIQIIGDMPVYVDYTSVDVWANQEIFQLDEKTLLPTVVSGFPPDDCSKEGQNWNMPIYDWNNESKKPLVFKWWIERLRHTLRMVDVVRIDHFRGLESFWAIPVDENFVPLKPKDGQWYKAPGVEFFTAILQALGEDLPLIVEDLGGLSKEVFDLRDQFRLTGIRILQFGFNFFPDNMYRPHNYIRNCVAYTGTHDNPTVVGWWTAQASEDEKKTFVKYIRQPVVDEEDDNKAEAESALMSRLDTSVHWYFIQMTLSTVADTAIIQFQDLLGLDNQSRMNDPSLGSNPDDDSRQNWSWRFTWSMMKDNCRDRLKFFTMFYNRDGLDKKG